LNVKPERNRVVALAQRKDTAALISFIAPHYLPVNKDNLLKSRCSSLTGTACAVNAWKRNISDRTE
jgi:hypothetical protein